MYFSLKWISLYQSNISNMISLFCTVLLSTPSFSCFLEQLEMSLTFSFSAVMGLLSYRCHFFRRLGAGRAAAGVPGPCGGAEGPLSEQTSRVQAHPPGSQKPHGAGGRKRGGGLGLWWVTESSPQRTALQWSRWCLLIVQSAGSRRVIPVHPFAGVWGCTESPRMLFWGPLSAQTTAAWHFSFAWN